MPRFGALGLLLCLLGACSPTSEEADADANVEEHLLELGGSDNSGKTWVDWSSGDAEAEMQPGPQGCCHVWVSMRSPALKPGKVKLSMEMFLVDSGVRVLRGELKLTSQFKAEPAPAHLFGVPGFIDCPCAVGGRLLRVQATATDANGTQVKGEGTFTPSVSAVTCTGAEAPGDTCIKCPAYDVGQANSIVPCDKQ